MKYSLFISLILTIAIGCAQQRTIYSSFDTPQGVTHKIDENIEFHVFNWGKNETAGLFMMSPHPAGLNHAMVARMTEDAIPLVKNAMREVEGVEEMETSTEDIVSGAFSGTAIVCKLKMNDASTIYQTMHILWDGNRLWQGQMSGHSIDDLRMVELILKSRIE